MVQVMVVDDCSCIWLILEVRDINIGHNVSNSLKLSRQYKSYHFQERPKMNFSFKYMHQIIIYMQKGDKKREKCQMHSFRM